eukprot:RCo040767
MSRRTGVETRWDEASQRWFFVDHDTRRTTWEDPRIHSGERWQPRHCRPRSSREHRERAEKPAYPPCRAEPYRNTLSPFPSSTPVDPSNEPLLPFNLPFAAMPSCTEESAVDTCGDVHLEHTCSSSELCPQGGSPRPLSGLSSADIPSKSVMEEGPDPTGVTFRYDFDALPEPSSIPLAQQNSKMITGALLAFPHADFIADQEVGLLGAGDGSSGTILPGSLDSEYQAWDDSLGFSDTGEHTVAEKKSGCGMYTVETPAEEAVDTTLSVSSMVAPSASFLDSTGGFAGVVSATETEELPLGPLQDTADGLPERSSPVLAAATANNRVTDVSWVFSDVYPTAKDCLYVTEAPSGFTVDAHPRALSALEALVQQSPGLPATGILPNVADSGTLPGSSTSGVSSSPSTAEEAGVQSLDFSSWPERSTVQARDRVIHLIRILSERLGCSSPIFDIPCECNTRLTAVIQALRGKGYPRKWWARTMAEILVQRGARLRCLPPLLLKELNPELLRKVVLKGPGLPPECKSEEGGGFSASDAVPSAKKRRISV